jgi:cell division septum initiation protein DivIVA
MLRETIMPVFMSPYTIAQLIDQNRELEDRVSQLEHKLNEALQERDTAIGLRDAAIAHANDIANALHKEKLKEVYLPFSQVHYKAVRR